MPSIDVGGVFFGKQMKIFAMSRTPQTVIFYFGVTNRGCQNS